MRKWLAIFIFSIFAFHSLLKTVVMVDYVVRYDYYANVLCVNKAQKNSCCKGSCQIKKELNWLGLAKDNLNLKEVFQHFFKIKFQDLNVPPDFFVFNPSSNLEPIKYREAPKQGACKGHLDERLRPPSKQAQVSFFTSHSSIHLA